MGSGFWGFNLGHTHYLSTYDRCTLTTVRTKNHKYCIFQKLTFVFLSCKPLYCKQKSFRSTYLLCPNHVLVVADCWAFATAERPKKAKHSKTVDLIVAGAFSSLHLFFSHTSTCQTIL